MPLCKNPLHTLVRGGGGPLMAREIEVLRYLALGGDIANITA